MLYGTVVQYFPDKGFGFIRPSAGRDVFFHVSALGACLSDPQIAPGQAVKYALERRVKQPLTVERTSSTPPNQRAAMVELIERIPGGTLKEPGHKRHPRARQRKPTWRR